MIHPPGVRSDSTAFQESARTVAPTAEEAVKKLALRNSRLRAFAFLCVNEEDRSSSNLENAVADSRLPRLRFVDRTQVCWHVVDGERCGSSKSLPSASRLSEAKGSAIPIHSLQKRYW
jgi:hypothetical protein